MVSTSGKVLQEVRMGKESKWKPGSIFFVKDIIDVADVMVNLNKSLMG